MARTISEIKKTMTDAFLADENLRELYSLEAGTAWGDAFSAVSLENILLYIVAACCWAVEVLMDTHKEEVNEKISRAVVASVPWYYKMAKAFQYGDSLVLDETTMQYGYAVESESKQVVKYAAVRDKGTSVEVLVSGETNGSPSALSDAILTAFKEYMNRIKIAGVVMNIRSEEADDVRVYCKIYIDPLVMNTSGELLSDGSRPVDTAIEAYLKGIIYGGKFNKTKLVDAIQAVDGVEDVELEKCLYKTASQTEYSEISGNNYTARGGSFTASALQNTITYVAD